MKPTITFVSDAFNTFNKLYFNNELPAPKFKLDRARSRYGVFTFYYNKVSAKMHGVPNGTISISTYFDRTELAILGTILHEMIHAWQYYKGYDHGHGFYFKKKAAELNVDGWGIQRCGGTPRPEAFIKFHSVSVPTTTVETPSFRKIQALKRSISHLEALPILSAAQKVTLELRRSELNKLQ